MRIILYHNFCQDGFFSAYLFWDHFGQAEGDVYIPVSHRPIHDLSPPDALTFILENTGITKEQCQEIELYILDYSLPVQHTLYFDQCFKQTLIIDHHISAILMFSKEFTPTVSEHGWQTFKISETCIGYFSQTESAAKMVYRYFYDNNVPWYIEFVSDQDLREFKMKDSGRFYKGMTLYKPFDFRCIQRLIQSDFKDVLHLGDLIDRNNAGNVKDLIETRLMEIAFAHLNDDRIVVGWLINSDICNANDIAEHVFEKDRIHQFCIVYSIEHNNRVSCSIRSTEDFDCLSIANHFHGGGHGNAAGFGMSLPRLLEILNTKTLVI